MVMTTLPVRSLDCTRARASASPPIVVDPRRNSPCRAAVMPAAMYVVDHVAPGEGHASDAVWVCPALDVR